MDRVSSNEVKRQLNSSFIVTNFIMAYFIVRNWKANVCLFIGLNYDFGQINKNSELKKAEFKRQMQLLG